MIPKLKKNQFFKAAKLDGWDNHTGNTINYRELIGKTVRPKDFDERLEYNLCSNQVLHACKKLPDVFRYVNLPCSLFIVEGKEVTSDENKSGFKELKIIKEIPESNFDKIFPFKYNEIFRKPLDPRTITPPPIDSEVLKLLSRWGSVWDSVWGSVRGSVWDSVWGSVWDSVWGSVWDSVWGSVRDSVRGSVWGSVWDSVRGSEYAYLGTLFPNVKSWYLPTRQGRKIVRKYPYQDAVELLKLGLVPAYNDYHKVWYLLSGPKMKIVWEGKL